jgi:hypothetical protein
LSEAALYVMYKIVLKFAYYRMEQFRIIHLQDFTLSS